MSNAAIAVKVGARVAREIAKAIERDRRNRYVLNAPWTVPRLSTPVPHFSNDALQIDGKLVTILPFAGANACDGNTLAPDKYPLPGRMRGKVLFAFIAHDRIYAYLREIAEAWGWTGQAVRKWADDLYYAILDAQGVPRAVSWLYYQGVRFGGRFAASSMIVLLSCLIAGCGGCATPPDDFFEPGQDLAEPDYTKIAALSPGPPAPVPRPPLITMPYDLPRIPLPTDASSADLARLPSAIRRQALFSARLNALGPLAQIGADIKGILDGNKSASESRRDIRQALAEAGYQPPAGAEGGLLDHTSRSRLDLILQQNVRAARGYGKWAADMDPDRLDLWPAQELVRVFARRAPRGTWKQRWEDAGGQLYGGRMIALKTSPVWVNISRFQQPYPPYDFGSGMGVVDIDRDEAVRLGLLQETEALTPETPPFPDMAEARMPDLEAMPALRDAILKVFGDGARFDAGVLSMPTTVAVAGADGSARTLGLGSLADRTVTPAPAYVAPDEARRMIDSGEAVGGAPGRPAASISPDVERHWRDKGYDQATIDSRLKHIRQALAAIQEPQEEWERPDGHWYLREFAPGQDGRRRRVMVQADGDGRVITWIPTSSKPRYFERKRTGVLQSKEGAR